MKKVFAPINSLSLYKWASISLCILIAVSFLLKDKLSFANELFGESFGRQFMIGAGSVLCGLIFFFCSIKRKRDDLLEEVLDDGTADMFGTDIKDAAFLAFSFLLLWCFVEIAFSIAVLTIWNNLLGVMIVGSAIGNLVFGLFAPIEIDELMEAKEEEKNKVKGKKFV